MKILKMEQGSDEWLIWRLSHITATDCAVILNKNPFKDPMELWQEKLLMKEREPVNKAMMRGTELEPKAREIACKETGILFSPAVVESEERPWQVASLDGLSPCLNFILEIKCPNEATHAFAATGGIHNYYTAQMQHQLAVTGASKCYYMSYRPENETPYVFIEVFRDEEYISDLIEAEHKFYIENLCQMREPATLKYTRRNT